MSVQTAIIEEKELVEGTSLWKDAWRRLRKNRLAVFGGILLIITVTAVLIGPVLSPYTYDQIDLNITNETPSWKHWFGTDQLGRDILVRSLVGGRISLMVGLVATAVSFVIGVTYGAI